MPRPYPDICRPAPMIRRLAAELRALRATLAGLSPEARRAAVVLIAAVVLVLVQVQAGTRDVYRGLGNPLGTADPELGAWAWWFGMQGLTGFVVPVVILLADKPAAEAYLSILGGLALGALVWRCRSFWIAVPIHAAQMVLLDLFCTLRFRTGASGIGLDALAAAFGAR